MLCCVRRNTKFISAYQIVVGVIVMVLVVYENMKNIFVPSIASVKWENDG